MTAQVTEANRWWSWLGSFEGVEHDGITLIDDENEAIIDNVLGW